MLLAGIVAVAALVAGCGGSEGKDGRTFEVRASTTVISGADITKAGFVARVNRLCRHRWPIILENFAKFSSWQSRRLSDEQLFGMSVRGTFLASFDFYVFDGIYRLRAPAGEKRQVEEVIGALQTAVELGQREVLTPTPGRLDALFAPYNRLARRYGLSDCLVDGGRLKRVQA